MQVSTPPTVGQQAPDFALTTTDTPSGTITLHDLTSPRTLIIFSRHLG